MTWASLASETNLLNQNPESPRDVRDSPHPPPSEKSACGILEHNMIMLISGFVVEETSTYRYMTNDFYTKFTVTLRH